MAEDEDRQFAAVLAKLTGQDAAAAEDARAALEWIAGDQGLVFITQQRIQDFCWYDLPVKWLIDLDDKLRVVAALSDSPAERAGVRSGDVIVSVDAAVRRRLPVRDDPRGPERI